MPQMDYESSGHQQDDRIKGQRVQRAVALKKKKDEEDGVKVAKSVDPYDAQKAKEDKEAEEEESDKKKSIGQRIAGALAAGLKGYAQSYIRK